MKTQRRFAFSLRTVFVLLTALAVWLGLAVNRAREQREAVEAIGTFGIWGSSQRRAFEHDFNQLQSAGDYAVWPFIRRADFEESLAAAFPLMLPGSLG